MPILPFLGEGSRTKIDYCKKSGTHMLTSPLEDLVTGDISFLVEQESRGSTS